MKYVLTTIMLLTLGLSGCNNNQNTDAEVTLNENISEIVTIDVSSESLTEEGKWITTINSTNAKPAGSNLSPQLSWSEVDGAKLYAIYMIDTSAGNWLHWKAHNIQVTNLELGVKIEDSDYVGPYPPSGIHEYEIIVYALKAAPDNYAGSFNSSNPNYQTVEEKLDTTGDKQGNIIGKGSVIGTVSVGEAVE